MLYFELAVQEPWYILCIIYR